MKPIRLIIAIVLSLLAVSCASTGSTSQEDAPPAVEVAAVDAYQIGVDDMVQVSVWRNPELGVTVPVRPDGKISVPLVGDVAAGGRTPAEVAKDIQEQAWPPTCAIRRSR